MASIPVTLIGVLTYSDVGIGGGPMPGGPEVSHPIAPGGPPPGIWPSPGYPAHPIAPGGPPPGIWPSPGHPAHPIAPGGQPPGIWPSPGQPAHPIAPGGPPPGIWPSPGVPTHPIAPGGEGGEGGEQQPPVQAVTGWGPNVGWFVVYVPTPGTPVPTPSTGQTPPEGQPSATPA